MARSEIHVGDLSIPSGTLVVVDTVTLAGVVGEDEVEGEAALIEGVPRDRPIRVIAEVEDGDNPWIEALRFEIGDPEGASVSVEATVVPAIHEVILIDVDAADRFEMDQAADGLSDVLLWGDDAERVAEELGAVRVGRDLVVRDLDPERLVTLLDRIASLGLDVAPEERAHTHYFALKNHLAEARAAVTTIAGMTIGIAMLALQAVGSTSEVKVSRNASGEIVQIAIRF